MLKINVGVSNETMCIAKTSFRWFQIVHNSVTGATSIGIYSINKENCSDKSDQQLSRKRKQKQSFRMSNYLHGGNQLLPLLLHGHIRDIALHICDISPQKSRCYRTHSFLLRSIIQKHKLRVCAPLQRMRGSHEMEMNCTFPVFVQAETCLDTSIKNQRQRIMRF